MALGATAERLFAARRSHPWPPTVITHEGWVTIYAEATNDLEVIDNIDDALTWANEFIARATC